MTIARNGYPMKKIRSLVFEYLQIALAILLASIGLKAFLLPNGFLDGGVTGIAILLGEFVPIEISYILPIISIPFFILGWLTLTKRVMIKSVISVLVLAVVLLLFLFLLPPSVLFLHLSFFLPLDRRFEIVGYY